MIEDVKRASEDALVRISEATTADEVRALEAELLGKRGPFAMFKTGLGALATVDDKRAAGQAVNEATNAVSAGLDQRRRELAGAERLVQLAAERLDLTEVMSRPRRGHAHVVTQAWERLEDVFIGLGFQVAEGPHVDHSNSGTHGAYLVCDCRLTGFTGNRVVLGPPPVAGGHPDRSESLMVRIQRSAPLGRESAAGKM